MPTPTTTRAVSGDKALAAHLSQTFNYMAGGVAISGLVAYFMYKNPELLMVAARYNIVWFIAILGVAFFLQRIIFSLQPMAGLAVFGGFSALMGFVMSPIVAASTGSSIASAFGVAAIMFTGTAAYGYYTQKSLSGWGTFLIMGVWGLVGVSIVTLIVSMFGVNVGPMGMVINLIAVPLFAGMTAWEVNTIKETFASYGRDELTRSRLAILQATSLYINFINMFISLLQLMNRR